MVSDKHCGVEMRLSTINSNMKSDVSVPNDQISHSVCHLQWNSDKSHAFEIGCIDEDIRTLEESLNMSDLRTVDQVYINDVVNKITSVFERSATDCGMLKNIKTSNKKNNKKRLTENKPWYDTNCELLRKRYMSVRNINRVNPTEANKDELKKVNKLYKHTLVKAYTIYHK